ncbi:hypothetical protein [Dysgonomonas sp. 520]|uniref:hypothetical protein n=1 Tax=Dysgonomonas sp. 520 TaxID=2302931 RepID=UPI0013D7E41C|nr:hypothetical protein [Dysgonomonas sp. 520]NDW09665.1 hypothetical protein [Dysgonomonas sp. 520]
MKKLLFVISALFIFGLSGYAQKTVYNFNDKSWGEPVTERPEAGSFTSTIVKDVKFNHAQLFQKEGKGTIRVILDKKSTKSNIEFPEFENAKEVIIEASTGSEGKTMSVEQKVLNKWVEVGEPTILTKQKAFYSFSLDEDATQIRISNPTTSALYIYKVTIK